MKIDVMWPVSGKKQFPQDIQDGIARMATDRCLHVVGMTAEKVRFSDGRVMIYALLDLGEVLGEPLPVLYGRTEACGTSSEGARLVTVA